jgi:hypothetical protein
MTIARNRQSGDRIRGEKNPRWKGGRYNMSAGYGLILMPDHPRADKTGYVFEHIVTMEKMLGRPLVSGEVVHHCDGNPANNGPFNLRLFSSRSEHIAYHGKLKKTGKLKKNKKNLQAAYVLSQVREAAERVV